MAEFVDIKNYPNREEAELAKNLLEANGIKAVVFADDSGGATPSLGWGTGGVRLKVLKGSEKEARELLEEQ